LSRGDAPEDALDRGLPRACTPELDHQKCASIFEHFYVSYPERDASVYADTSPLSYR
jgi:hypothetical protein